MPNIRDQWFIKKHDSIEGTHIGIEGWDEGFLGPLSQSRAREVTAVVGGQKFRFRMPEQMANNMMNQVKAQYRASKGDEDKKYAEMVKEMNAEGFEWERKVDKASYAEIKSVYENEYKEFLGGDDEPETDEDYPGYYEMLEDMQEDPNFDHKEITDGSKKKEDIQKAYDAWLETEEPETIAL